MVHDHSHALTAIPTSSPSLEIVSGHRFAKPLASRKRLVTRVSYINRRLLHAATRAATTQPPFLFPLEDSAHDFRDDRCPFSILGRIHGDPDQTDPELISPAPFFRRWEGRSFIGIVPFTVGHSWFEL